MGKVKTAPAKKRRGTKLSLKKRLGLSIQDLDSQCNVLEQGNALILVSKPTLESLQRKLFDLSANVERLKQVVAGHEILLASQASDIEMKNVNSVENWGLQFANKEHTRPIPDTFNFLGVNGDMVAIAPGTFIPIHTWLNVTQERDRERQVKLVIMAACNALHLDIKKFSLSGRKLNIRSKTIAKARFPSLLLDIGKVFLRHRLAQENVEWFNVHYTQDEFSQFCPKASRMFDELSDSKNGVPNRTSCLGTLGTWYTHLAKN